MRLGVYLVTLSMACILWERVHTLLSQYGFFGPQLIEVVIPTFTDDDEAAIHLQLGNAPEAPQIFTCFPQHKLGLLPLKDSTTRSGLNL